MTSPRVRFAPSPTGLLHLGNARTALMTWLFSRGQGGHMLLRLDDTDQERSQDSYKDAIKRDLQWLGLDWDDSFCQSARSSLYAKFIEKLKVAGHLYPCYETPQELEHMRQNLLSQSKPPLYRQKHDQEIQPSEGAHWRFRLVPREVSWDDGVQGVLSYHTAHISDPIVVRQDGSVSYLLSSVIDDVETAISHVLRGADHITNTALQIEIFHALGSPLPIFAHFPLISSASGRKFSKRLSSLTISDLREQGFLSLAICQSLASLGRADFQPGTLQQMAHTFSIHAYNNTAVRMMDDHLTLFNQNLLRSLSWSEVKALKDPKLSCLTPEVWSVLSSNVESVDDIDLWMDVLSGKKEPSTANADLATAALTTLPQGVWDSQTWSQWLETLLSQRSEKKGTLSKALRTLLTGRQTGPRMDLLLPLMGKETVQAYLAR